jgi:hypothetical protein
MKPRAHRLSPKCVHVTTYDRTRGRARTKIQETNRKYVLAGLYFSNRKRGPDIEIYIDGVARMAQWHSEMGFARLFVDALIHEICNHEGFNEGQTHVATKRVMATIGKQ